MDHSPMNQSMLKAIRPYSSDPDVRSKGSVLAWAGEDDVDWFNHEYVVLNPLCYQLEYRVWYDRQYHHAPALIVPREPNLEGLLVPCAEACIPKLNRRPTAISPFIEPAHYGRSYAATQDSFRTAIPER
ncbi:hypothetical protein DL766_004590 [Monosporascus sp. MC13-8B]|uniref:Uncharacterized protein n=1 Tax=Monosporascus cannonballus TaxID=155416 RepID=A0ABY0H5P9_9PEZI|nr:hypothetical protein DL762_006748 [Monosporascus cannonballus]RYO85116.1 hypothetical protein DL763_007220 [Monosporascus cannonballus]RYP31070.1 hypothetical protein DL766_004590 [Monosporascus sp. MC13-8B]